MSNLRYHKHRGIFQNLRCYRAKLHLVKPLGFEVTDKNLKRAGLDYWNELDITYYNDLEDFFYQNSGNFYYFTTKGKNTYSDIKFPDNCILFSGARMQDFLSSCLLKIPKTV